ncbi:MAG: DUF4191 domain-containing protein [Bifidobacteriaceae bacterium]|jgi:hypothetical protein|nr:DUF4191 domain-containing protein [Bifidobacteriaceae bacterium]
MAKGETVKSKQRFKTIKQLVEVFKITKQFYPHLPIYFVAALILPLVLVIIIAFFTSLYWLIIFGVLLSLFLALFTLSRFGDKASYKRIHGQTGAAGVILNSIKIGGFSFEESPVAFNAKNRSLVFRGVGRPGVILVSEGPSSQVRSLLIMETKKIKRILPNVPVIEIQSGEASGQVPLPKLKKVIVRQKVVLTKDELAAILKRLKALGGLNLPIPKGIDPNNFHQSRKVIRG